MFQVFKRYQDENQRIRWNTYVGSMEMRTLDPAVWAVYVTVSNPFLTSEDACRIIREATGIAGFRGKYNVEREQASDAKATEYFQLGFESDEEAAGFLHGLDLNTTRKDAKVLQWWSFQVLFSADLQVAISDALARRQVFDENKDTRAVNAVVLRTDLNRMPVKLIKPISLSKLTNLIVRQDLNCKVLDAQNFGMTGYDIMQCRVVLEDISQANAPVKRGVVLWEKVLPQFEALQRQVVKYKLSSKKRTRMIRRIGVQGSRPGSPTYGDQDSVRKSEELVAVFADKFKDRPVTMEGVEQKFKEVLAAGPTDEEEEDK